MSNATCIYTGWPHPNMAYYIVYYVHRGLYTKRRTEFIDK